MKTKRIIRILTILSCIAAAILLIAALHLFRSNHNDSPGWRLLKTQDSYTLDSQQMNGADSHTLNLTDGDVLQVTEFEINLSQTGAYTVTVEARHAKGSIHIQVRGK